MKKVLFLSMAIILLASTSWAGDNPPSRVVVMSGSTAISAGADYSGTSTTFTVGDRQGYFTIQASATGSGTAKIEYYVSVDGTNYAAPQGSSAVITGLTSSSGIVNAQFFPDFCEKIRIVVTETGGVSTITPTIYLLYK